MSTCLIVDGPQGCSGPLGLPGMTGATGPATAMPSFSTSQGVLATTVTVLPATVIPITTVNFTFPATGGPWRAQGSYFMPYLVASAGASSVSTWIGDSFGSFASAQVAVNNTDSTSNVGFGVSPSTYGNGDNVTFTLFVNHNASINIQVFPLGNLNSPNYTNLTISSVPSV